MQLADLREAVCLVKGGMCCLYYRGSSIIVEKGRSRTRRRKLGDNTRKSLSAPAVCRSGIRDGFRRAAGVVGVFC